MATASVPTLTFTEVDRFSEVAVVVDGRHVHSGVYDHADCRQREDAEHAACHGQVRLVVVRDPGADPERFLWSLTWRGLPISDHHPRGTNPTSTNGHAPSRREAIAAAYAAFVGGRPQ